MSPLCYLSCLLEWWEVDRTHVITCRILVEATGYTTITPFTSCSHTLFLGNFPVSHRHTRCSLTCHRLCCNAALCLLKELEISMKFYGASWGILILPFLYHSHLMNSRPIVFCFFDTEVVWSGLVHSNGACAKTSCSCRQKNVLFDWNSVMCTNVITPSSRVYAPGPGWTKILKITGDFLQLLSTFMRTFSKGYGFSSAL